MMVKPRLLPLAIIAMGGLFLVKSENIIRPLLRGDPALAPSVAPARAADIAPPLNVAPEATRPPGGFQRLGERPDGGMGDAPNPISQAERALLEQLRARRAELEAREQSIASRELVLGAAQRRLGQLIEELTQLQQRLEAMERTRSEREEAGWRGLVRTYENMRPREAAAIFEELELPVVIQILDRMGERKMAPVIGAMRPEKARVLTAELARHRANRPGSE
jgi:flagellar motility protein MotE (MotC chaperone)